MRTRGGHRRQSLPMLGADRGQGMDVRARGQAGRWGLRMLMAALACGATASATAQSSPHARSVLGPWVGTYVCSQGLTGLTLSITEATPTRASALFHFYADPRNPRVEDRARAHHTGFQSHKQLAARQAVIAQIFRPIP